MADITLSLKESERIRILEQLKRKEINQKTASLALALSIRQVRRVLLRYKEKGAIGLVHQGRGRPSNRQINPVEIERALTLIKEQYPDFGPTFALEKLAGYHGITFGVDTLRYAMIKAGIWQPHKRKTVRIHQLRERRSCEGELVQLDGSPYDWLEGRGNVGLCTLLVTTDDATSDLEQLLLVKSESTASYFEFGRLYFETKGKPLAWYSDKHGVFRVASKEGYECREDSNGLTQFGRAMQELGIKMIFANSPQAKGRVERANKTLQDRLVKELRLRGISSLAAANEYLPEFVKDYNHKFGVKPKNPTNMHQILTEKEKAHLGNILVEKYQRRVSKNLTVHYQNCEYQILSKRPSYTLQKAVIEIWDNGKGKVRLVYQGKELNYRIYHIQPKAEVVDSKRLNQVMDMVVKTSYQSYFDQLSELEWNSYHQGE